MYAVGTLFLLIGLVLGFVAGAKANAKANRRDWYAVVQLGRFVYDGRVYEVRLREKGDADGD